MVDTIFAMYASKETHKKFIEWANNQVKYPYEGKTRKGEHRPLVGEVKLYGSRVKKELLPQMLKDFDIKYIDDYQNTGKGYSHDKLTLIGLPMKIFRFIFRQKKHKLPDKKLHSLKGWKYAFHIMDIKDHIDEKGEEAL